MDADGGNDLLTTILVPILLKSHTTMGTSLFCGRSNLSAGGIIMGSDDTGAVFRDDAPVPAVVGGTDRPYKACMSSHKRLLDPYHAYILFH